MEREHVHFNQLDQEIFDLKEKVSSAKSNLGIEHSIPYLRILYSKMLEHGGYGVEELLRLPLYLQESGQFEEALEVVNDLAAKFPEPHSLSIVADKRRLMFQRENRYVDAIPDGVTAYLFKLLGHYQSATHNSESAASLDYEDEHSLWAKTRFLDNAQYSIDEINIMQDKKFIQGMLLKLLKKAKRTELLDELTQLILQQIHSLPGQGILLFEKQLRKIIQK